jgi:hypothetical protein
MPLFSLYCFIFFFDQIQFGENMMAPGFHAVTLFVYAVTINMLKGLKTFAGLMVFIYCMLSVGSFSLICLISRSTMSELVDTEQELLMINLCASVAIFFASYIFTKINFSKPIASKYLPMINQTENIPNSLPSLFILTGLTLATNFTFSSGEMARFIAVLSPLMFLAAWKLYLVRGSRNIAIACFFLVVVSMWTYAGLSGMKSSLLLPLIGIGGAAAMMGIKFKRLTVLGFALLFVSVSVVAFAIQPLRNLKGPITNESRFKLAIALIVFDLDKRYDLSLDIKNREVNNILDRLAHENRDLKKGSSAGILTRMSYFEDDSKMIEAVRQKGEIPLEKYFEEIIIVPRVISGRTFVADKISAFYGRYAEVIDRFNTTTGIAFSGHIISYAHGGYVFMLTSMFISVLSTFILVTAVFGKSLQLTDLASLFALLYITIADHSLSLQSLWFLLTRGIPAIIVTYSLVYFAIQLVSDLLGSKSPVQSKSDPVV